jgi:hypothetical protein
MSSLMQRIRLKQQADKAKAEARLEKRRGYARAARDRALAANGLADLPVEVAVAIEELPTVPESPAQEAVKPDASVEELVARLEAIKTRILRLHVVYATTLSFDCAMEANRFVTLFQTIATELKEKQPEALDNIIAGHEALLMSPPIPVKKTIPIATQQWVELVWESQLRPIRRPPKRDADAIPDGLGWML